MPNFRKYGGNNAYVEGWTREQAIAFLVEQAGAAERYMACNEESAVHRCWDEYIYW